MKALIVGGAGYLGSNLCIQLSHLGYDIVVLDDFVNAPKDNVNRLNKAIKTNFGVVECSACDKRVLESVFVKYCPDVVVHYANKKYIGESFAHSLDYYENNLISTFNLLRMCEKYPVKKLLFASSVSVYADCKGKIAEEYKREFASPYCKTKIMAEEILTDWQKNNPDKIVIIARYTNPVGASQEGLGDKSNSGQSNVLPYIVNRVKQGQEIIINGGNLPTKDGSAVRDFIHVSDLTRLTAELINSYDSQQLLIVNIGIGGDGNSIKDLIDTLSTVINKPIQYTYNQAQDAGKCKVIVKTDKLKQQITVDIKYNLEDIVRSQLSLD